MTPKKGKIKGHIFFGPVSRRNQCSHTAHKISHPLFADHMATVAPDVKPSGEACLDTLQMADR